LTTRGRGTNIRSVSAWLEKIGFPSTAATSVQRNDILVMTYTPNNLETSREFQPFFEGLTRGCISFPRCVNCERFHWYPTSFCPYCGSDAIQWKEIDGTATLYSWTTVHHAFSADLAMSLPYIVALVEFPEAPGIRLVTNIVGSDSKGLFENMPLVPVINLGLQPTVTFRPLSAELRGWRKATKP
jgi:uncharacterized protein